MCWLYVVLRVHLCVGYMWCLKCTYVLAICGAWSAPMCWLYVVLEAHLCVGYMCCGVLGTHLVQEGSGPCKIPNFPHLLWSYGTYMYFVRHVRIDPHQSSNMLAMPSLKRSPKNSKCNTATIHIIMSCI